MNQRLTTFTQARSAAEEGNITMREFVLMAAVFSVLAMSTDLRPRMCAPVGCAAPFVTAATQP